MFKSNINLVFFFFSQNESPDLTEEQLLGLLDGCEMTDSCAQDLDTQDTMLWDPREDCDGSEQVSEALFIEKASLTRCHYYAIKRLLKKTHIHLGTSSICSSLRG